MSSTHEEPAHWLHAAHGRVAYLETAIQQYTAKVAAGDDASPADFAGLMRAGIMLTEHKAELEAWRTLLAFWHKHQPDARQVIPMRVGLIVLAVYVTLALTILLYLTGR